ncbi:MAG: 2-C-methyl-D-erythritol 2,4-cyclodiphosphate synthase [Actinomycetota bacterium]|nr:2-C-methyl-D-erythritol 2,4-cyclodiphosphate synthase [Actinomycetota bacterium]
MSEPRIGLGFDVHPAEGERVLMLAGARFDGEAGLAGHSDGDVACHAMADAMLGAAGLGDIGDHFSEDDPGVAGIAGLDLLARAVTLVADAGWRASSCDLTVLAERPALAPRREEMRRNLSGTLGVSVESVSVKATRPEGLGLHGDGAGCIAIAVLVPR